MASESSGRTFQEYLEHHLQNLVYGPLPAGHERKFYSKGEDEATKETYCQDKGLSTTVKAIARKHLQKTAGIWQTTKQILRLWGFGPFMLIHYFSQCYLGVYFYLYSQELPKTSP